LAQSGRPTPISIDDLLYEIGHDHSAAALAMNAVRVNTPAVQKGDLAQALSHDKNTEVVTIERQESEAREGATAQCYDLHGHCLQRLQLMMCDSTIDPRLIV
jgi:hypothetical protein